MSLKRVSQLPAFNGIPTTGVGGTATLDIPVGPRYKAITLCVKDSANAAISTIVNDIRVLVNGKQQRVFNTDQLDRLNSRNSVPFIGTPFSDGTDTTVFVAATSAGAVTTSATLYGAVRGITQQAFATYSAFKDSSNVTRITINFSEPWRAPGVGGALAWPTGGLASFQLEVDIKTTAGTVTMTGFAEVDKALVTTAGLAKQTDLQMGNIVKWVRTSIPVTGTTVNWGNFPRHSGVLQAVHIYDASAAVTNVQVKADNYEWRNLSWNENAYLLAQNSLTPNASWYDIEFDYDDVPEGAGLVLDGIQDLQHNITLSDGTARNLTAICEILGPAE